jgi:hypothetical protein
MKPSPISTAMLVVSLLLAPALLAQSPDSANQSAASPAPSSASTAEVPRLIKFSGTLLDAQDRPMAGPVGVTFALHAQQTGGAALWLETQNVTPDAHGNYTVLLGANSTNGVPAELFASGEARWLEVQVERQAEQPRILLVSVPYALKAKDAETLGGRPASAFLTTETLAGAGTSAGTAPASSTSSAALPSSKAQTTPKKAASAPQPAAASCSVMSDGTAAVSSIALFTAPCTIQSSLMTQALINGFPGVNVAGNNAGLLLNGTGTHQLTVTGLSSGRLGQDSGGFFFSSDSNGKVIKFLTNNGTLNEWMRITSAGNVGIGTQTPVATLDVVGSINLPFTTGAANGAILMGGARFAHDFGGAFFGAAAGNFGATGFGNSGLGDFALAGITTGNGNTAVGNRALSANSTGTGNTAVGEHAGVTPTSANENITGSNNTFIGRASGPATPTQLTNATAIGANALVGSSNALVLGGTGANAVKVGIGTVTPAFTLDVAGTGNFTSNVSLAANGVGASSIGLQASSNDLNGIGAVITNSAGGEILTARDNAGKDILDVLPIGVFVKGNVTSIKNDATTGTVLNELAKYNPTDTASVTSAGDAGGAIGIVVANAGTAPAVPSAFVTIFGEAHCLFDNTAVTADYFQISATAAGQCHDSGAAYPTSGQVLGRVTDPTKVPPKVFLFGGTETRPSGPTYDVNGALQSGHAVTGFAILSGGTATVNLSGLAKFTSSTSYGCLATPATAVTVGVVPVSGSSFTLNSSSASATVIFLCFGN